MRREFDIGDFGLMSFELDGQSFNYRDTQRFAEIANLPADIFEEIRVTEDRRCFYATIVAAPRRPDAFGVTRGWYSARWITLTEAWKMRESWNVLRKQEDFPNPFDLLPYPGPE